MNALLTPSVPSRNDPFAELNEAQREAVAHGADGSAPPGPLLVIAGAGSGKTMTLACRVARLVLDGADPQRLLMLTFSRRAAGEMGRRVGRVLHQAMNIQGDIPPPALPWAGTFHGIGARLLREYAGRIGLDDAFTILDRGDAEDLMALARHELGLSSTQQRFPLKGTCLSIYSRVVNSQEPLDQVLQAQFPWCTAWEAELRRLFKAYVAHKQSQRVLDYDDLLLYWWHMTRDEGLARELGDRFDHVLVDEYQDTNRLQAAILLAMKPEGQGLTVVGDDAQSIYSFRAAEVRNILGFPSQFATPARIVTLARNYRSTQPILDASNAVIAQADEGYRKRLWTEQAASEKPWIVPVLDEAEQASWVATRVLALREQGLPLKSQAVLFRTGHHSAALELELIRRNIPFVKFGGLKFLEATHIKDVLSVLRWAHNPRSRLAGFRVAQLIPGVGPATANKALDAVVEAPDPWAALRAFKAPSAAVDEWAALAGLMLTLKGAGGGSAVSAPGWPGELEAVIRWYLPHLERLHDDARVRQGDLHQLALIAGGFGSRERFLTELTLDPPEATSDESGVPHRDEDYLILSTIHSAKGQEWSAVSVLNVVDGCLPADLSTGNAAQINEERRLFYVAMTRAKRHLHLMVPQRFYVSGQTGWGDKHVYGGLSRFVPPSIHAHFDFKPVPSRTPAMTGGQAGSGPIVNVGEQIRQGWD